MYQSIAMCVLSIPVWFIVIRWMHTTRWYWKALAHIILAPAYAVGSYQYLYQSLRLFVGVSTAASVHQTAVWILYFYLLLYFLQFALYHSYETLRKLRLKEKLTLELLALRKEQELATLKAQINPHFLFNALNSISAMAATDAEETRTMIAQLASLLRYATDSSRKDFIPLKDELQFVEDYIALETQRMGDRLSSTIHVDPSLASYPMPPMVLQPLIENAIRHGIAPAEEGGSVTIRIERGGDGIAFSVKDSGVGLSCDDPLTAPGGVGLKNTDARLRKVFGASAGLTIRPLANSGCEVRFTLPLR
jgi:sensor histidine kinase YesM